MRNSLFIFAVIAALPLVAAVQPEACERAMASFQAKDWTAAASDFAECDKQAPGKTDALLFRGKALINLGRMPEAANSLEEYAAAHPTSDDALYTLGYVQFREDRPRESLATYTAAARLKNPTDEDLKIVSLDYVLLQDYKDAARYLEDALKMNPVNAEARYHLGRVRYQLNEFDAAITAFQEVLRRQPGNEKAEYNLGLSFEGKNDTDTAIACYRKAIALDQSALLHDEQPYLDLGALLSRMNRAAEAIPLLETAKSLKPGSDKSHYELARAYASTEKFESAKVEAEAAIRLRANESSYHYLLGRIYAKLAKPELAAQQFKLTDELLKSKEARANTTTSPAQ